jgi:crossover junction endodeoxyribonuclease RuvC
MIVLGVDPGVHGALALLDTDAGTLVIEDMPTLQITRGGKNRATIAPYGLANLIEGWAANKMVVYLEKSWPRPSDGAVAGFGFGTNYGMIYGVCAAHFLRIELVSPQSWKKAMRVTADKDAMRARASTLMPRHARLWPLKKHDGRAEAALIACYGASQILKEAA